MSDVNQEDYRNMLDALNNKVDVFIGNSYYTLTHIVASLNAVMDVLLDSGIVTEEKLTEYIKKNFETIQKQNMELLNNSENSEGEDVQEI